DVDAVEEHRQRHAVHLHFAGVRGELRKPEPPALEALVDEHETAAGPEQDLAAIEAAADEHEQVPGEQRLAPAGADQRGEPVVTATEVDGLRRETPPHAPAP